MLEALAMFLFVAGLAAAGAAGSKTPDSDLAARASSYFSATIEVRDGVTKCRITINGPPSPPEGFARDVVDVTKASRAAGVSVLSGVPAFDWSFGCSATSAAMIAGYYDRNGYPNMYTGPTNGGVCPLDNTSWPHWVDSAGDTRNQCPLSATRMGLDGRSTRGHVDDYWVKYDDPGPDPFIGRWAEHSYSSCTGDFMKTNQSTYGNADGGTRFWYWLSGAANSDPAADDGGYGLKLFYESRGYRVVQWYNQYIRGVGTDPSLGFTFDQYKAEIDAGRPVMIQLQGHTVVGVGYDSGANLVYLHDTWDYATHTMNWGGSYSGMPMLAVTIVELQAPAPTPPARVTNFRASDGENGQSTLTWTNPSDSDLAEVSVRRKTGSYPTSHTDGTSVYSTTSPTAGAGVSTTNTGLANGTTYYYAVFGKDSAGSWNDTVAAGSNADTGTPSAAATPPARVTNFRASDGENGQSTLTWTNPSDSDLAEVSVRRKTGSYPTSHTDGTSVYSTTSPTAGAGVSTTNTGLANGTTYYYAVFGKDSAGSWNDTVAAGSNADTGTPSAAATPPARVTNFRASDGENGQSMLTWTNPSDSDLAEVSVRRKTGSYPTSHTDGTSVYSTTSPTPGAAVGTTNAGLTNGTTYYYAVFGKDSAGSWNDTVVAGSNADTGTPSAAATPPARVTNFRASDGENGQSTLTWTNPSDSDLAEVSVRRKTGSYPTSHTDGTSVYSTTSPTPGAAVGTTNTGLTNGTTYYYAVFGKDSAGSWNDTVAAGSNADTGTPSAAATPPARVTNFQASDGENGQSMLTWTNPSDSDLAEVSVRRKTGSYPTSHTDGIAVYHTTFPASSAAVSTLSTGLTNGTTYYYAVFGKDSAGSWNDTVVAGSNADTAAPAAPAGTAVGYWRFNEGTGGTTADSSGKGNTATLVGAAWASGSPDGSTAMLLSGVSSYVRIPNKSWLNFDTVFTVEAWIKPGALSGYRAIAVKRGGTASQPAYGMWTRGNRLYGEVRSEGGTGSAALTGSTTLVENQWHHVALRRDSSGVVTLWVDGVQQAATAVVPGKINPYQNLYVGRQSTNVTQDFIGLIDEVRVSARALDPGEFNLPPTPPSPPATVRDFVASDGENGQSTLTWTNPGDADLAEVVVRRQTGSYPSTHAEGVAAYSSTSLAPGAAMRWVDTGLANGTTYYYAVFARDAAGNWNDTVAVGWNADIAVPALRGYWRFNEGTGTTSEDSAGGGRSATLVGGASWSAGSPDDTTALLLPGSGAYARILNASYLNFSAVFTIEAWIRPGVLSGYKAIVVKRGGTSVDPAYGLWTYGSRLYGEVRSVGGMGSVKLTGNTTLTQSKWYHVALRRDVNGVVTLWVDGVQQVATGVVAGEVATSTNLYIGRQSTNASQDFIGLIDEVRVTPASLDPGSFNLLPTPRGPEDCLDGQDAAETPPSIEAVAVPNPASDIVRFTILGATAAAIRVDVLDLAGHWVWSGESEDSEVRWDMISADGERVANGVYLYRLQWLPPGGVWRALRAERFFVVRE